MIKSIEWLALAGCLVALALAPPATAIDAKLESQLQQVDAAAQTVKDLTAHFEQDKFTALLKKPLVSTGTVRGAGSVIRWDTEKPEPCALYADQKTVRLYYPKQKLEEIYPIDQQIANLLSSPVPRLASIRKFFTIAAAGPNDVPNHQPGDSTLALRLAPSDESLAKHVRQVVVLLDIKTGLTLMVQTIDSDGDRTQITFLDARVNTGLDPGALDLKVPADTTISHPLDSAPASSSQTPTGSP
jgi:outer membrane lipoprotein-sorting protein